ERGGLRYVFHLRPGVKFHDGRPVTPADVRASFLRVLDPATTGGRAWPLLPIAGAQDYASRRASDVWGIQPLGDTAVAIELTEPLAVFPEPLTQAAEFDDGRLSVVEVPFGETARWERERPDLLVRKPGLRAVYVAMNVRRGALQDVRVRQAINYAVNVPEILRTVWSGRGVVARGAIPPALPGGDTTRRGYGYDPARARQLLSEAGYPKGLDLELWR